MPSQTNLASTYVLLVFIWATTPLAIVWSVSDLHVMWALLLRFYIALPLSVIVLLVLKLFQLISKLYIVILQGLLV